MKNVDENSFNNIPEWKVKVWLGIIIIIIIKYF